MTSMIIFIMSCIFMFLKHPLALGGILFFQTALAALSSNLLFMNSWYSYILFLIMIGGMLILFIYMTSIASNEKFFTPSKWKILIVWLIISIFILFYLFLLKDPMLEKMINSKWIFFWLSENFKPWTLSKFFNEPFYQTIIFLMIYLFLTLIAIVKITGKPKKALRQMS
uniref:NADH-ubiquinone oxidoreductase chain 6 n=1 Tax=Ips calligraphus TaxID=102827 RepID=A0A8B0KGP7_9CUCU|nr:NADH dehydrogenase subunit 6 [Ips calligraphus]QTV76826.1 NADH dehydrogenase subunit 6 [Ips calligraphus]